MPESAETIFLERLGDDYRRKFDQATIDGHLRALHELSAEKPVAVLFDEDRNDSIGCTIIAFDHAFEFSSITGLMAGTGFSIESSDAFTLARAKTSGAKRHMFKHATLPHRDPASDPLILDHFRGRLLGPYRDFDKWRRIFEPAVVEVLGLLDREDDASTERAKRLVVERVTQWLKTQRPEGPRALGQTPVEVVIEELAQATRIRLHAADGPAFLYALSTALSLHGLQIQRTSIATIDGRAVDEIDVVDGFGKPLAGNARVQQLRLSVLLTQQFAYFLDRSPDPFTALLRFEELSEKIVQMPHREKWLELLADPPSMTDLAKVLGASDYLWEDFIKLHADLLLPVFSRRARGEDLPLPSRSLPRRLEESLIGAKNFDEQRAQLNEFKDRELFLIDLDHILSSASPDAAFQILSERLVLLAENLVATSARLVHVELCRLYGKPTGEFAIFGLGKLGGVALGYASDIELLFIFSAEGQTAGGTRGRLQNDEFFAILTRETCDYIQAKREGIFQVDLRLRPYGKSGPLACSKPQFAQYYGPGGKAHPFERLALGRLRWIAGQPKLGFEIEQLRDKLLYDGPPLDLDAIWEISAKMSHQHLRDHRPNSKFSPGGLIELEQVVQLLQVMHSKAAPQLRTPRLHGAIESLRRAGVLTPIEFEELMGAYQFLRRLINAQRMLQGASHDLELPSPGSDEWVHLARRMNYSGEDVAKDLLEDFQSHTKAVRQFIRHRFDRT